jgi:polyisoprenyl-teichoic acid--peptidoglycan teichoic acid transferase
MGTDTDSQPNPDVEAQPKRGRSPLVAAALSYVWPGLGQWSVGRRRSAVLFFVPALLVAGWFVVQLGQGLAWFGLSFFDETFVATLIAISALLGVWRILAVGHAFLSARRDSPRRRWEVAVLAALVVSIVVVHGAAIGGTWAVYQTSVAINHSDMLSGGTLAEGLSTAASQAPSAGPSPSPTPGDPSPSAPGPTPSPEPTPTAVPTYPVNPDRIAFLLVGVDFMTGRAHALTDTMILATLDVHTNKATIISVPRDTSGFDLYYGGKVASNFKLNELMSAAASASFGSPDSNVNTLKNEIGFLVGLPIDYYVAVDLEGFVKLVEAVGGIDIDVKTAVNDPFSGTFVPVGMIHMDGHLALKYSRSRMSSSDYARAARQQDVLVALARKIITPEVVPQLPDLLSLAGTTIATDFPLKNARNFVSAFRRVGAPATCVLGPPYSYHPDSSTTGGTWTSRLDVNRVANLSVYLFGAESLYFGRPGVTPAPCGK